MQNVGEKIAEIKDRIKKIDVLLDSDISDELFDSLEAEAITLTEELGRLDRLFLETGDYIHFLIYNILLNNISLILKIYFQNLFNFLMI